MKGRIELPEGDKKQRLVVFVEKKKIDKIGSRECIEAAKEGIEKEYQKQLKNQKP